ncbi:MAG: hypothetical protein WCC69_01335 [Pirellulales bacterium]
MLTALLASSAPAHLVGNLLVAMSMAGLAAYGWQHGVFLAVIAGLQVLGSFIAALALVPLVAAGSEAIGCPPAQAIGVAYLLTFLALLIATRLAVGGFVPEGAVRFAPIIDRVTGGCFGAMAGFVLGGSLLIGWSQLRMPESFQLEVSSLKLDAGARLLATFGRCVESNPQRRAELLGGDPSATARGLLDCYREGDWRTARRPVAEPSGDGAGEDLGQVDGAGTDAAPAEGAAGVAP